MLSNSHHHIIPSTATERIYLESLIREAFERAHPGETFDDVTRRASSSKEDRGLLRDWLAVAHAEAASRERAATFRIAAE